MSNDDSDLCLSTDTASGDPCQRVGSCSDGRCSWHSDDEGTNAKLQRGEKVTFRMSKAVHERLYAHQRQGETLSGAVGRALDALEREQERRDALAEMVDEKRDGEFVLVEWGDDDE